ncbi:MAG TPA: hypothetical protein VN441_05285, partial [Syntrophomonas sp.]|nr:hypothetical protein [Syntrophomonas sp.]
EYESYKWITRVAEVIGLPASQLRAALARQEIPFPDDLPQTTPEEAFKSTQEDFADIDFSEYAPSIPPYLNDPEAMEYLEEIHKRPEMKTLFDASRKATKKDIEKTIAIIETLKKQSGNEE